MYSDRMSSRPMGWSEAGADAMCQLRCYVKDYGEEKILELVKYRRSHKQEEATGIEGISVRPNRGYMRSLLLHHHDNDRVYNRKDAGNHSEYRHTEKAGDPGASGWYLTKGHGRSRL